MAILIYQAIPSELTFQKQHPQKETDGEKLTTKTTNDVQTCTKMHFTLALATWVLLSKLIFHMSKYITHIVTQ